MYFQVSLGNQIGAPIFMSGFCDKIENTIDGYCFWNGENFIGLNHTINFKPVMVKFVTSHKQRISIDGETVIENSTYTSAESYWSK